MPTQEALVPLGRLHSELLFQLRAPCQVWAPWSHETLLTLPGVKRGEQLLKRAHQI